jgi:hypothetical protein
MSYRYVGYNEGFEGAGAPMHRYGDNRAWSSINDSNGLVVLAMWESLFKRCGDVFIFDCYEAGGQAWHQQLSPAREKRNRLRSNHLQSLRTTPRKFKAFITVSTALDEYLEVAQSMIVDNLELELCDFKPNTCEHRAKVIRPSANELEEALRDMRTKFGPKP